MTTATTTSVQLYGNPKLPSFTALVDQVESQFSNWNQYIDVVTSSPDAALLPFGIEPDNLEDCKRAWVEISPYNRDDDAVNVISEAATGEKFDLQAPELEERFEFLLTKAKYGHRDPLKSLYGDASQSKWR